MNIFYKNQLIQCTRGVLFCIVLLAGCQSIEDNYPDINIQTISIMLDADANENSATSVDLIVVYDKALVKSLMGMDSKKYFANLNQIRRDYPEMVDIWHWELTPGQVVTNYPITLRECTPLGAVIYADFYSPGDHRIRLGSSENIHVQVKRLDFCVLEQGCFGEKPGRTGLSEAIDCNLKDGISHKVIHTITETQLGKCAPCTTK